MKLLIDILHPAHVHFFRNFIKEVKSNGHKVLVTTREKDIALDLLDLYNIKYTSLSKFRPGMGHLIWELIYRNWRFRKVVKKFKPNAMLGLMGPTIATSGRFKGIKKFVFWDTENSELSNKIVYPLVDFVCTPSCYEGKVWGNHITYGGYHELAFLHPNKFKPNQNVLKRYGLKKSDTFFLLRFVSWGTYHEIGEEGFVDKIKFVKELEKHGKVFISSEDPLPQELEKFRFKLRYDELHDFLAFATLYIGESATIASEAAVLGVPAIYVSSSRRGYTNELEKKYGLVYNISKQEKAMKKALDLLRRKNLKKEWQKKRDCMLKDKIDVTSWLVKFVEENT